MATYSRFDRRPKRRTADVPRGDGLQKQLGPSPEGPETSFPPQYSLGPSVSVVKSASCNYPASTSLKPAEHKGEGNETANIGDQWYVILPLK